MAEGLLRALGGEDFDASSAGTHPTQLRREAIEAMAEAGVDISGQRSKSTDEFIGQAFDYVITVCDNAAKKCPTFPGEGRRLHWPIPDPANVKGSVDEVLEVFREVRDEISARVREFVGDVVGGQDALERGRMEEETG